MTTLRKRWIGFFAVAVVVVAIWLLWPGHPLEAIGAKIGHKIHQIVYLPLVDLVRNIFLKPIFYIVITATLLLERLFPAQRSDKFFSASRLQDFVWLFYESVLHAAIVVTFTATLYGIYEHYFKFLTIGAVREFPEWARFLIAVLVQDFTFYLQHWVHHRVPWLWHLHALHHSQKELSFFTDFRYHILEYVLREVFLVVPFLILGITPPVIVYYVVFRRWYTHFYHANIKTDLGFLRYILVTPQSHRVHHSIEERHMDKNFGSVFSFWDFIFGTQYKGWDEYPQTGISDEQFPHETRIHPVSLIAMPVIQMMYPFKVIWREIRGWIKRRGKSST